MSAVRLVRLTISLATIFVSFALLAISYAQAGTSGISYQGRILKPNGDALEGSNVQFRLQLKSPGPGNCLMYEELQSKDMRDSGGMFALTINDGSGARTDTNGTTLEQIFANRGSFTFAGGACASGTTYVPNESDGRSFAVFFKDETMSVWEPVPPMNINYVPFAFETKQIAGFGIQNLVRVEEADGTLTSISPLSNANYDALKLLVAGTSGLYERAGRLGGAAITGTPSAGQVLSYNGTSWTAVNPIAGVQDFAKTALPTCGAGQFLKDNGSGFFTCATPAVGGGGTVTSVAAGTGLTTGGSAITSTGTISLDAVGAGGTGFKVTYDTFGRVTNAVALVEADIPTLTSAGKVSGSAITSGTIGGSTSINTSGAITTTGAVSTGALTATSVTAPAASLTALTTQSVQVYETTNNYKVTVQAPASLAADYALTLPPTAGVAGKILGTTGSGVLAWVDPSNASQWTTNGSNIHFDTGNVGIGTATPTQKLQIVGTDGVYSSVASTTTGAFNEAGLSVSRGDQANGYAQIHYATAGTDVWNIGLRAGDDNLHFKHGATDTLSLGSNGNVGVGVMAPVTRLQVAGSLTLGDGAETCSGGNFAGALRYNTSTLAVEFCNGIGWLAMNSGSSSTSANLANITNSSGGITLTPAALNSVTIASTVASTSPTSGALIVSGGLGVDGAINASGGIKSGGVITAGDGTAVAGSILLQDNYTNGHLTNLGTEYSSGGPVLGYGVTPSTAARDAFFSSTATPLARSAMTLAEHIKFNVGGNQTVSVGSPAAMTEVMRIMDNGNVGVGTTAPTAKLDVYNGQIVTRAIDGAPGLGSGVRLGDDGVNSPAVGFRVSDSNERFKFAMPTAGVNTVDERLSLYSNSSGLWSPMREIVSFGRSGNVGIGTTAPIWPLTVSSSYPGITLNGIGNVASSAAYFRSYSSRGVAGAPSAILTNDPIGGIAMSGFWTGKSTNEFVSGDSRAVVAAIATEDWTSSSNNGTALQFRTTPNSSSANREAMRIDQSGYVGIGTSTPTSKLMISGLNETLNLENSDTVAGSGSVLQFGHNQSGSQLPVAKIRSYLTNGGGVGNRGGQLRLSASENGVMNDVMMLSGDGKVGIGTTSPSTTLEVAGTVKASAFEGPMTSTSATLGSGSASSPSLNFSSDPNTGFFNPADDIFGIATNGIERLRVDTNGHVGIGTQAATSQLTVEATNNIALIRNPDTNDNFANGNMLVIGNTGLGTNNNYLKLVADFDGDEGGAKDFGAMGFGLNDSFKIWNPIGPVVLQPVGGNVGIGTTDPTFGIPYDLNQVGVVGFTGRGVAQSVSTGVLALANNRGTPTPGDHLGFVDFASVGNGTGAAQIGARIFAGLNGAGGTNGYGADLKFSTKTDNALTVTEKMRITSVGNVGIGTSTPDQKLVVSTDTAVTPTAAMITSSHVPFATNEELSLDFGQTTNSVARQSLTYFGGAEWGFKFYTYNSAMNSTPSMTMRGSGNIGIGTTTPTAKLEVAGQVRSVASTGGAYSNSSASVDWDRGNVQEISTACTSTSFTNMLDAGTYVLAVTETGTSTCIFSQSGLTFYYSPANGARSSGARTVYTFQRIGNSVYVVWNSGFQ